jgi:hypothetical protein
MKQIVIYPGRFQPMLSHHAEVFDRLQAKFPNAEVYIGTSDKTDEDKSPFNFKEKQIIAQGHGIDSNNVLFARSPYVHTFYDIPDQENKVVIFAVGEKDRERFTFDNIDDKTGLNMKKNGEPYYYQMINTYDADNPVPMTERGYIYNVPNIESDEEEIASASAFRNAMKNAPDEQSAKAIFNKQFKNYNESLFNLVYKKIAGNKMKESLDTLKKLAGLEVSEDAPVEFETPMNLKDIKFTPPSKSSSYMSIANRFPEGSNVNDPEVKKEEFIKVLLKAPLSLLSEINERISPADDNGLAVSTKLSQVIDNLGRDGDLKDLKDDDRAFAIKIVKLAIDKMELEAGDDSPTYDELEGTKEESLDLSDIRDDYGIEEDKESIEDCILKTLEKEGGASGKGALVDACKKAGYSEDECEDAISKMSNVKKHEHGDYILETEDAIEEGRMSDIHQAANEMDKEDFAKEYPEFADDWESMQNDPDAEDEPRDDGSPAYKKYIGKHKHDESVNESEPSEESISDMSDEDLMDYVGQKEEDLIDDMQQHIAPDFLHKDNYEETFEKYREEVLEPAAHDISQDAADGMEPRDAEESVEDTGNKALEAAMEELKKLAGLELEEKEKTEPCPKCGKQRIILKACASCGCS